MKDKFICMHPFIGFDIDADGIYQVCCQSNISANPNINDMNPFEFFNSEMMDNLRQAYLKDKPEEEEIVKKFCNNCIYKEKISGDSKRLRDFSYMGHKQKMLFEQAIKDFKEGKELTYRDLRFKFETFGNICNLKCIMCGPSRSSAWAKETQKYKTVHFYHKNYYSHTIPDGKIVTNPINDLGENRFVFYDKVYEIVKNCTHIDVSGGEPSLSETLEEMLNYFVEKGGFEKKLTIHLNTNCTCDVSYFEKLLQHYKVEASISLDAYGKRNDYIRHGLKWKKVEKNMFEYSRLMRRNKDFFLGVCITPQVLNCGYIQELTNWLKTNTLAKINMNQIVDVPKTFSFRSLPPKIKKLYYEKVKDIKEPFFDPIKNSLLSDDYDEETFKHLVGMLNELDTIRYKKIKWPELWPEIYEYYETIQSK